MEILLYVLKDESTIFTFIFVWGNVLTACYFLTLLYFINIDFIFLIPYLLEIGAN